MRLTNPMATLTTTPRRLLAAFLVLLVVGAVATLTLQRASSVLSGTTANSNTFGAANCFAPVAVAVGSGTSNVFVPATVSITAGSCVKWTQGVTRGHDSTSSTGLWASPTPLGQGNSFERKFPTAVGSPFNYKCSIHPGMTGTITVT